MSLNHVTLGGLVDLDCDVKSLSIQGVPVNTDSGTSVSLVGGVNEVPAILPSTQSIYQEDGSNSEVVGISGTPYSGQTIDIYCTQQASNITVKHNQNFGGSINILCVDAVDIVISPGECAVLCYSSASNTFTCTYQIAQYIPPTIVTPYLAMVNSSSFYSLVTSTLTPILSGAASNITGDLDFPLNTSECYHLTALYSYVSPNTTGTYRFNVKWDSQLLATITGIPNTEAINNLQPLKIEYWFSISSGIGTGTMVTQNGLEVSMTSEATSVASTYGVTEVTNIDNSTSTGVGLNIEAELGQNGFDLTLTYATVTKQYTTLI